MRRDAVSRDTKGGMLRYEIRLGSCGHTADGFMTIRYLTAAIFCLIAAISPSDVGAQAQRTLENDLKHAFEHKFLSLKTPYFGSRLQFDSSGHLVGSAATGPWSTCGVLQVDKLMVHSGHLEIEGKRVILALRSKESAKQNPPSPQDVEITPLVTADRLRVFVDTPSSDTLEVKKILSQVFQGGQLSERIAAYWKPRTTDIKSFRKNAPNAIVAELEGNRPVYVVNPGVVDPPKPIDTPDPTYTDAARQNRTQGTAVLLVVVNEKGFPEILEITKSLGEGLDTQALAAVARWRFRPGLKDGQPVAVAVNVEVSFRL